MSGLMSTRKQSACLKWFSSGVLLNQLRSCHLCELRLVETGMEVSREPIEKKDKKKKKKHLSQQDVTTTIPRTALSTPGTPRTVIATNNPSINNPFLCRAYGKEYKTPPRFQIWHILSRRHFGNSRN
ncbi:hypothetical protein M8J75_005391 [Diaphorina citri]|nr:hypothetical protein M8J75_005391 [Diaphorina citri]